jgi:ketosteroid isomerase-like protein
MTERQTDLDKLKAAFKAWHDTKGGSIDTWLDLMADHVDWRSLANGVRAAPWTATRTTREEVRGYLVGLTSAFSMDHYTVEQYVCDGETIVTIGTTKWHHKTTGKPIDTPIVTVWRFLKGQVVSFFEYYDTAKLVEAATPD